MQFIQEMFLIGWYFLLKISEKFSPPQWRILVNTEGQHVQCNQSSGCLWEESAQEESIQNWMTPYLEIPQSNSRISTESLMQQRLKLNLSRISLLLILDVACYRYFCNFLLQFNNIKKKSHKLSVRKISPCLYLKKASES